MRSSSVTHCLESSLRKRYACKLKNSFTKENAQDHVLFSEQIRNVDCKINTDKKQDHLRKHKAMHNRATGKPDGTSWISVPGISLSTVQQQDERRGPTFQHKEQHPKVISQTHKINRFSEASQNCCKIWRRQRISNSVRILQTSMSWLRFLYGNRDYLLKCKRSHTISHKDNYDFNSISGFFKKNSSRGPKHGESERQIMFFKA